MENVHELIFVPLQKSNQDTLLVYTTHSLLHQFAQSLHIYSAANIYTFRFRSVHVSRHSLSFSIAKRLKETKQKYINANNDFRHLNIKKLKENGHCIIKYFLRSYLLFLFVLVFPSKVVKSFQGFQSPFVLFFQSLQVTKEQIVFQAQFIPRRKV